MPLTKTGPPIEMSASPCPSLLLFRQPVCNIDFPPVGSYGKLILNLTAILTKLVLKKCELCVSLNELSFNNKGALKHHFYFFIYVCHQRVLHKGKN